MQLINRVLDILNSLSDVETVLYESPYFSNIKIDRLPAPYAICYLAQELTLDTRFYLKEGVNLEVFFCSPVKLDADGPTHQAIVDDMTDIAKQFIYLLRQQSDIVIDDVITLRTGYGRFDKNVTGVSLELKLTERQAKCLDSVEPGIRVLEITENGEYDTMHYGKVVVNIE